ncbi:MAG: amidohydrolase family protein [Spirochaetia bacterium]|jgi:predicted TIM-barrel fold metal-dependent hydrolase
MLIDFHYHCVDLPSAVDDLLKDMDASGVERTLLMGGPEGAWWDFKKCGFASNERVAEAVKAHPERLLGNVYLDPRDPAARETFRKYRDFGFRAVKLFPPAGFDPSEEMFFPLYEEIEAAGLPVLAHAGQTNIRLVSRGAGVRMATDSRFAHPMNFDRIARLFPGIHWVLAHMGYPFFFEAWSVANANNNVYLDISGSGPWTDGIPLVYNANGGSNYIPLDFRRILWGSDNCLPQAEHIARMSVFMRQIGAGSNDRTRIFGDNAKELLKL